MSQNSPIPIPAPRWGKLKRGARRAFLAGDGEATTGTLTLWCRPRIVLAGGKPSQTQMIEQARSARSIGAYRVRRVGRNEWIWRLPDEIMAKWR